MNKKIKNLAFVHFSVIAVILLAAVLLLSGCFSPWGGDEGTLSINLGGNGNARAGWDILAENSKYSHEIILEGPGGTIRKTIDNGSRLASFQLAPGAWHIIVRAMGDRPEGDGYYYVFHGFPKTMLKALGYADVEIKAGQNTSASVYMVTATEVFNFEQLQSVLSWTSSDIEEYVLVANSIPEMNDSLYINTAVTLVADRNVRLTRMEGFKYNMFQAISSEARLTLGRPGMKGSLTIDGGGYEVEGSLLYLNSNTQAVIYEGVALVNNKIINGIGGAIYASDGNIIMNGGVISNNSSSTSSKDGAGGGVYMNNGQFTMNGGIISNNACDGMGGGVCVDSGEFIMTGGRITGNKQFAASDNLLGGGVFVGISGSFTMRGNAIVSANSIDAVNVRGIFYMRENASISGNEAWGIRLMNDSPPGGRFFIEGGLVYGYDEKDSSLSNHGGALITDSVDCVAQYGTFDASETWNITDNLLSAGQLATNSSATIRVVNGVLMESLY